LAEPGCDVHINGLIKAANMGHMDVVKWLLDHKDLLDMEEEYNKFWLHHFYKTHKVDSRVAEWMRSPEGLRALSS
jgi:hypothetical protein